MPSLRSLRRDCKLTLTALALHVDIPVRTLAAAELGLEPLEPHVHQRVATALGVLPEQLHWSPAPARTPPAQATRVHRLAMCGCMVLTLLASCVAVVLQTPLPTSASLRPTASPLRATPPRSAAQAQAAGPTSAKATAGLPQATAIVQATAPTTQFLPAPLATATPLVTPDPSGAPHGCPLLAASDRIVITQGYNTGTHAPANVWGALDLAIDTNGDAISEPDSTRGIVILATNNGVADVTMDSWPGGNFVRIANPNGWSSAYAHLDSVAVSDGQ
ncbi:MAG TPA: hypothetical protein VFT99_16235, partial [Roseiflexaceae bacterium]|nr:hypothetical protein [Roseiflexaceae bacterium]